MTASTQNPPAATSPLDGAPLAVRAFVAAHDLTEQLAAAVRLGEEIFPTGSGLALRIEDDPDCEGQWVVMDWELRSAVDEAVGNYLRFVSAWNAFAPPWVGNVLRVTFHFA